MTKVVDIKSVSEKNVDCYTSEVICLSCHKRWIAVYPTKTWLKDLECAGCGLTGFVIETGQSLFEGN